MKKTSILIKAVVALIIAATFVLPGSAHILNTYERFESEPVQSVARQEGWIEQASGFWEPSRGIRFMHAVDENTAWAVGYDGSGSNVYETIFTHTSNGGDLWEANIIFPDTGYGLGNICGLDGDTAWAAVFSTSVQDENCGIYKTTDGGSSWIHQFEGPYSFANNVYFWDENEGMCCGDLLDDYFEVYTTNDGGTTWNRVPLENFSGEPVGSGEAGWTGCIDYVGDTVLFGTNQGNVYKSDDRGHTWVASYTGIGPGGLNPGVNEIAFKDANNGLAAHDNGITYDLYTTSDGGATWSAITPTGTAYSAGLSFVPGTDNTYISTGAVQGTSGASYSVDGGNTWVEYPEQFDIQMLSCDFVNGGIGWAGAFNEDEFIGGMWKYVPGAAEPALTITSIVGGKGLTATVNNVGTADATNVEYDITITGGLFINPKTDSGNLGDLAPGESANFSMAPKGIGLGFIFPQPEIEFSVNCTEGASYQTSRSARILFSRVFI